MTQWCSLSVMKAVLCVGCTEVDYVTTVETAPSSPHRTIT